MKRKSLNENQIRTIWAVFGVLSDMPYEELNKHLGSITIGEMKELYSSLNRWYRMQVLGQVRDEETGIWEDRWTPEEFPTYDFDPYYD